MQNSPKICSNFLHLISFLLLLGFFCSQGQAEESIWYQELFEDESGALTEIQQRVQDWEQVREREAHWNLASTRVSLPEADKQRWVSRHMLRYFGRQLRDKYKSLKAARSTQNDPEVADTTALPAEKKKKKVHWNARFNPFRSRLNVGFRMAEFRARFFLLDSAGPSVHVQKNFSQLKAQAEFRYLAKGQGIEAAFQKELSRGLMASVSSRHTGAVHEERFQLNYNLTF